MKVRLALEEKGLAWTGRVIDIVQQQEQLQPWYLALNPKGVVPTLEYSNASRQVVTDSVDILRFIGQLPDGNPLVPQDDENLVLMNALVELADGVDLQVLSYARHPSQKKSGDILNVRIDTSRRLAQDHPELVECYRECAARSEKMKAFRASGEQIEKIEGRVVNALAEIESRLTASVFLTGYAYTLADVIWTVVLSRLELLGYEQWLDGKRYPLVSDYYQRVKQRESFTGAKIQNQWWQ